MSKYLIMFVVTIFLVSCSTQVIRKDVNSQIDLSGKWNDTDSRLVAEEMVSDLNSKPWYGNYISSKGRIPSIVVGKIRNRGYEHINTQAFVKDIEREFINSGGINFVASKQERSDIGSEMDDQIIPPSSEIDADFILIGTVNTIFDKDGDESVRYYQVDLELVELDSRRKVWIGDKKIKKFVEKNSLGL